MRLIIRIQEGNFDVQREVTALTAGLPECGAVATFVGIVRERTEGEEAKSLFLEHYPGMTERSIERIVADAGRRWPLLGVCVIHRVGLLSPNDQIVLVITATAHRQAAFESCAFLMDYLKTNAVFWKREEQPDGSNRWIESTDNDHRAARQWQEG